jgi:hypothetical protein
MLAADLPELERRAHSDAAPWSQVRRARIVLGIADGQRREDLAAQLECDQSTIWPACQRYRELGLAGLLADHRQGRSGRDPGITPVQRAQSVELAGREPVAKGLHITHGSRDDLARQAVADGIVARLSPPAVRNILAHVDRQPHRTRYWKTPRRDGQFQDRAEPVLWCYANASRLAEEGVGVVCVDAIPTFQVLERDPIRRAIPGSVEQQGFDDTRHGTVNMPVFLVVHSGLRASAFLASHDAEHYRPELELFHRQHKELRGVFLIRDGGSSHRAARTRNYVADRKGWWRPR